MKRIFQILIIICILSSTISIAATKGDVIAAISASYNVAGTTFRLPAEVVSKGTEFLNKYEMTSSQYSQILGQINKAVSTVNEIGTLDINKMTDEQKSSLIIIVLEVIKIANLDMEQIQNNINVDAVMEQVNNSIKQNNNATTNNNSNSNSNNNKPQIPSTDIDNESKEVHNNLETNEKEIFFKKTGNILTDKQLFYIVFAALLLIMIIVLAIKKYIKVDSIKNVLGIVLGIYIFVLIILLPLIYLYIDNKSIVNFVTYMGTNNIQMNSNNNTELDMPKIVYNQKYAQLTIETLDINLDVYYGDSDDILQKGIGHYAYSYLPGEGKEIIYTTHNTKDKLYNLKDIKINDEINIKTIYGDYKYKVYNTEVILETDKDKIKNDTNKEILMLYTCYPFNDNGYTDKRFIVYCELVEE